jgi:hypothetical protein
MSEIIIKTDGTIEKTSILVDGVDMSTNSCLTEISMFARAPFKGSVSGDTYPGYVDVSYGCVESGVITRTSICTHSNNTEYGIGMKPEIESDDQVIQYIGKLVDKEKSTLINKIVDHCQTNNIACPTKDELTVRTKESLQDKLTDLGITLEG